MFEIFQQWNKTFFEPWPVDSFTLFVDTVRLISTLRLIDLEKIWAPEPWYTDEKREQVVIDYYVFIILIMKEKK